MNKNDMQNLNEAYDQIHGGMVNTSPQGPTSVHQAQPNNPLGLSKLSLGGDVQQSEPDWRAKRDELLDTIEGFLYIYDAPKATPEQQDMAVTKLREVFKAAHPAIRGSDKAYGNYWIQKAEMER